MKLYEEHFDLYNFISKNLHYVLQEFPSFLNDLDGIQNVLQSTHLQ